MIPARQFFSTPEKMWLYGGALYTMGTQCENNAAQLNSMAESTSRFRTSKVAVALNEGEGDAASSEPATSSEGYAVHRPFHPPPSPSPPPSASPPSEYVLGPKTGTCKDIDAPLIDTRAACTEAGQKLHLGKFSAVNSKKYSPSKYPIAILSRLSQLTCYVVLI